MALPYELYDHILAKVPAHRDLRAAACACSVFHDIAIRYIYRILRCDSDPHVLEGLLATITRSPDISRSVRVFDLTWKLETSISRFVVQECKPTEETLRTIADAASAALKGMSNLKLLALDHGIDEETGFLQRCTFPSLSALQAHFSMPVREFLARHPHISTLELLEPRQASSAASTLPPGEPLRYFGGTCSAIAALLAPESARELAHSATLHVTGPFSHHARAFGAIDAWQERTGRRLGWLLVNYATLGMPNDPAGEVARGCRHVQRLALVGDKLHLASLSAFT